MLRRVLARECRAVEATRARSPQGGGSGGRSVAERDDKAEETARLAVEICKKKTVIADCHCLLGRLAARRGNEEEAKAAFRAAAKTARAGKWYVLEIVAGRELKRHVPAASEEADAIMAAANRPIFTLNAVSATLRKADIDPMHSARIDSTISVRGHDTNPTTHDDIHAHSPLAAFLATPRAALTLWLVSGSSDHMADSRRPDRRE